MHQRASVCIFIRPWHGLQAYDFVELVLRLRCSCLDGAGPLDFKRFCAYYENEIEAAYENYKGRLEQHSGTLGVEIKKLYPSTAKLCTPFIVHVRFTILPPTNLVCSFRPRLSC
jgi:hypothetical protein